MCPLHVSSGPSNDKSPEWRQDMAGVAVQKGFTVVLDMPHVYFSGFTGVCVQHLYNALVNETHRLTVKKNPTASDMALFIPMHDITMVQQ